MARTRVWLWSPGGLSGPSRPAQKPAASNAAQLQGQAKAIAGVLTHIPMTVLEINAALYSDYTALQVANAVKQIPDAGTCKVRRMATNIRGEKVEREYAAYFIKERSETDE